MKDFTGIMDFLKKQKKYVRNLRTKDLFQWMTHELLREIQRRGMIEWGMNLADLVKCKSKWDGMSVRMKQPIGEPTGCLFILYPDDTFSS